MTLFLFGVLGILGLFAGSFVGVAVERIIKDEPFLASRSRCDFCRHTLHWYDLVPLLSYILLQGRCRYCQHKIDAGHVWYEVTTAALFVSAAVVGPELHPWGYRLGNPGYLGNPGNLLFWLVLLTGLWIIFLVDARIHIIPDVILGPLVVIGYLGILGNLGNLEILSRTLVGLGAAGSFLTLVLVTKGRGMGLGDVKFAFLMGLVLGYPHIIVALYVAFLTGAIYGVILILLRRKKLRSAIPFGPFLIIGMMSAMIFTNELMYLSVLWI